MKTATLPCTAAGFAGFQCPCDTCGGGTTPGAPCASDTDCPGGGLCGANRCIGGPSDGHCSLEPFRGCNVDAECNPPACVPPGTCPTCTCGQTCVFSPRPCHVFPINLQGDPSPFVVNDSSGTSLNTFCIPPTTSPAVNTTAGLPGEGMIIVPHTFTKKFPSDVCGTTCP